MVLALSVAVRTAHLHLLMQCKAMQEHCQTAGDWVGQSRGGICAAGESGSAGESRWGGNAKRMSETHPHPGVDSSSSNTTVITK